MGQARRDHPQSVQQEVGGALAGTSYRSARLSEMPDCYKIKLRSVGYRLVYQVYDDRIVVAVIAVGHRDRGHVYKVAASRVTEKPAT